MTVPKPSWTTNTTDYYYYIKSKWFGIPADLNDRKRRKAGCEWSAEERRGAVGSWRDSRWVQGGIRTEACDSNERIMMLRIKWIARTIVMMINRKIKKNKIKPNQRDEQAKKTRVDARRVEGRVTNRANRLQVEKRTKGRSILNWALVRLKRMSKTKSADGRYGSSICVDRQSLQTITFCSAIKVGLERKSRMFATGGRSKFGERTAGSGFCNGWSTKWMTSMKQEANVSNRSGSRPNRRSIDRGKCWMNVISNGNTIKDKMK